MASLSMVALRGISAKSWWALWFPNEIVHFAPKPKIRLSTSSRSARLSRSNQENPQSFLEPQNVASISKAVSSNTFIAARTRLQRRSCYLSTSGKEDISRLENCRSNQWWCMRGGMKIAPSLLSVLQTHSVDDLGTCMQVSCMALAHWHDPCLNMG